MPIPKRKYRQLLFQTLFSLEEVEPLSDENRSSFADVLVKECKITKKNAYELIEDAVSIKKEYAKIDPLIKEASSSYAMERITKTEKMILRLALYEMMYEKLPFEIAISEAIRITRKFGTRDSANFINAVLDHIYKNTLS